jgi:hypothetical protein
VRAITAVIVCAVAVLASTVSAPSETAPVEVTSAAAPPFQALKLPTLLWASGVAADQLTTYEFSSRYGLIRGLDRHPALLVTAGTAVDAATAWAPYRVLGRRHPRLLKVALYGAAAYRSYLAAYNVEMMRQARAIRATGPSLAIPH